MERTCGRSLGEGQETLADQGKTPFEELLRRVVREELAQYRSD